MKKTEKQNGNVRTMLPKTVFSTPKRKPKRPVTPIQNASTLKMKTVLVPKDMSFVLLLKKTASRVFL